MTLKVAFAGLTHLGVCFSVGTNLGGSDVIAFDTNKERVSSLRSGHFDLAEQGIASFLKNPPPTYEVTSDVKKLMMADLVFISLDTNLEASGKNDESEVEALLDLVASTVCEKTPIVIASQVRPGFSRRRQYTNRQVFYLMESLVFGNALQRVMNPEKYVLGVPDEAKELPEALKRFLDLGNCPQHIMSYESAELTKLSANFLLAANVEAANTLADVAQHIGADWEKIEAALRNDTRLGKHAYISAGPGIGGSNLPRDVIGIRGISEELGLNFDLASAVLSHSEYMKSWIIREVRKAMSKKAVKCIGLLGLAYKVGTTSVQGSPALKLIEEFEMDVEIIVHDTFSRLPRRPHGSMLIQANNVEEIFALSDVIAITTPQTEYAVALRKYFQGDSIGLVLDPFRYVDRSWVQPQCDSLIQLGVSSASR